MAKVAVRRSVVPPVGNGLLTGLISFWQLNENAGSARADSHGAYPFAEVGGSVARTTGKVYAYAADFVGGSNTDVLSQDSFLPAHDEVWTLALWARLEAWSTTGIPGQPGFYRVILSDQDVYIGRQLGTNNAHQLYCMYQVTNGSAYGTHGPVQSDDFLNTWHLIVVWFDPDTDTMYMQLDNEATPTSETMVSPAWSEYGHTYQTLIGNSLTQYPSYQWAGQIGPMAAWNRILTTDERTALWNSGNGLTYAEFTA